MPIPTEEIIINGFRFLAPCPYTEGHPCTGAEATILNRKLHSNLRSNFAKIMDEMVTEGKSIQQVNAELAMKFTAYCAKYSLNGTDDVEAEARAIALAMLKSRLRKANKSISSLDKAGVAKAIDDILASPQRQEIYEQARARLKMIREAAKKELARLAS